VLAWQDASTDFLVAAIAARPADEPMLLAAENALLSMAQQLESSEAIAIARLKHGNPALRARDHVKYEKMERAIAAALGNRAKDKSGQLQARLVAMITTGAMRIGGEIWLAQDAARKTRGAGEAHLRRDTGDPRRIARPKRQSLAAIGGRSPRAIRRSRRASGETS
jgi:hypothetical protein